MTHDAEALEFMVKRNVGDRIPQHFEAGAKSAEDLETRTRASFGKIADDIEDSMFRGARSFERESDFTKFHWNDLTRKIREGADHIGVSLGQITTSISINAEEQREALESHYRGLDELHRIAVRTRLTRQQKMHEAVFRMDADAARREFIMKRDGLSAAETYLLMSAKTIEDYYKGVSFTIEDTVTKSTSKAKEIALSESEMLASGLRVAMTNACGTVTGFQECVDGAVVEFDASMSQVISDAERLASGIAVPMKNACGTVTGFQKCVDGVVVEYDRDMNRILSDSDKLASGMLVPMTNACGTVTGFQQCVDGVVVEFDADMQRIVDSAEEMSDGVATAAENAMQRFQGAFRWPKGAYGGEQGYGENFEHLFGRGMLDPTKRPLHALAEFYQGQFERHGLTGEYDTGIGGIKVNVGSTGSATISGVNFFARGGVVRSPTLGVIGEDGPEAVLPLDRVSQGGITMYNTFNIDPGLLSSPADAGERVEEVLNALTARKGRLGFVDAS